MILLFALASADTARPFFAERWPEVAVVCEPAGRFHIDLLNAPRAGLLSLLRPRVWTRVAAARRGGHRQGRAQNDVWRLGGAMLIDDLRIAWRRVARDVSEHFDLADPALRRALTQAKARDRGDPSR